MPKEGPRLGPILELQAGPKPNFTGEAESTLRTGMRSELEEGKSYMNIYDTETETLVERRSLEFGEIQRTADELASSATALSKAGT
ncbi:hypothetical protein EVAR_48827_1 [Eumeta japonica]|uniref:Uncharacterized protein n=1 Tax=Eumeta variegata TaxID=151549 RepID=A0A4C1Y4K2_EUMVA|nr:hypothetical protein EVAR_48827_1 [Eumeta japonica]